MHPYTLNQLNSHVKKEESWLLTCIIHKIYFHIDHKGKTIKPPDNNIRKYILDFMVGKIFLTEKNSISKVIKWLTRIYQNYFWISKVLNIMKGRRYF